MTLCSRTRSFGFRSAQQFGFMEESCTTNQETKEWRPTQIDPEENIKQKENTPEEQEIQYEYLQSLGV